MTPLIPVKCDEACGWRETRLPEAAAVGFRCPKCSREWALSGGAGSEDVYWREVVADRRPRAEAA